MEKLRTQEMLSYIKERKRCSINELKKKFKVSTATIYRDISELGKRDAITRVMSGIIWNDAQSDTGDSAAFQERVVTNRKEKLAVARKALSHISEGDIVFLDSSTTVYELAMLLKAADFCHLTIVTNSVSIIQNFRKFPQHWVLIALGGNYDPQLNSILGAAALQQLATFNITKAFVSAFGVDAQTVTTNHERQAEIIRQVLATAEKRYLLVDCSKIGRTGLYRLAAKGSFDAIFS